MIPEAASEQHSMLLPARHRHRFPLWYGDREESPMAINLVSTVMQFLTPDMIERIASALGLDRNNVQSAVGAAVPGLLAGFSGVAAQSGGAQKLADAAKQQIGTLGSFAGVLGAGG